MVIEFKNIGKHLGTRHSGASVREKIIDALNSGDTVVFDFKEVETVANSFADECFAKLLFLFEFDTIKSHTTFRNASQFIKDVIASSFRNRIAQQHPADTI